MKRYALLLATITLAACSEQAPPPAQNDSPAGPPATEQQEPPAETGAENQPRKESKPEPFADVDVPEVEIRDRWLVLELGESEFGPTVGIGDGEKFGRHYTWELRPHVDKYLRLDNPDKGLPGLYADSEETLWRGLSGNPLVLRGWAHLSTDAVDLIHMCSEEVSSYHYVFVARLAGEEELVVDCEQIVRVEEDIPEPPAPEQPPGEQVEFPPDEMPPVPEAPPEGPVEFPDEEPEPTEPDDLEPWQKGDVTVTPVFDSSKEIFGFQTEWARKTRDHDNTAFKLDDLCSREGRLDRAHYERLRSRLAAAILERIVEDEGDFVDTVRVETQGKPVAGNPEDTYTSWLVFLLQIDAVNLINQSGELEDRKLNIVWSAW